MPLADRRRGREHQQGGLALKRPAGSYRHVEDKTTFARVRCRRRLNWIRSFRSTTYGSFRGLGVWEEFRTPSISRNITFMPRRLGCAGVVSTCPGAGKAHQCRHDHQPKHHCPSPPPDYCSRVGWAVWSLQKAGHNFASFCPSIRCSRTPSSGGVSASGAYRCFTHPLETDCWMASLRFAARADTTSGHAQSSTPLSRRVMNRLSKWLTLAAPQVMERRARSTTGPFSIKKM